LRNARIELLSKPVSYRPPKKVAARCRPLAQLGRVTTDMPRPCPGISPPAPPPRAAQIFLSPLSFPKVVSKADVVLLSSNPSVDFSFAFNRPPPLWFKSRVQRMIGPQPLQNSPTSRKPESLGEVVEGQLQMLCIVVGRSTSCVDALRRRMCTTGMGIYESS
jgi:hypothetical protein